MFKLHSIVLDPTDLGGAVTIGDLVSNSLENSPERTFDMPIPISIASFPKWAPSEGTSY